MHISKIDVSNVRGVSGSFDLGPCTIILGDNFSGKTGLLHAIRLGLFGWIPHPRKDSMIKPSSLRSGQLMHVALNWSGGPLTRTVWDPKSKEPLEISDEIFLSTRSYLDASPAKRLECISKRFPMPDDITLDSITATLKNIRLEQNTAETEKVCNALLQDVLAKAKGADSVSAAMAQMITYLQEAVLSHRQTVDRMAKTVAGMVQLETDPSSLDIGLISERIATKQNAMNDALKTSGEIAESIRSTVAVIEKAKAYQAEASRDVGEADTIKESLNICESNLAAEEAVEMDQSKVAAARGAVEKCRAVLADIRERISSTNSAIAVQKSVLDSCKNETVVAKHSLESRKHSLATTLNSGQCPTCGGHGETFEADIARLIAAEEEITDKALIKIEDKAMAAHATLERLNASLSELKDLESASTDDLTSAADALNMLQSIQGEHALKVKTLRQNIAVYRARLEQFGKTCAAVEAAKKWLQENAATLDPVLIETLRQNQADMRNTITELTNEIRSLTQQKNNAIDLASKENTRQAAIAEKGRAEAGLEYLKRCHEDLKAIQQTAMDAVFGGLMEKINAFTTDIIGELIYCDGDIGKNINDQFVSQDQFSDTEQIVTHAAIAAALASRDKFRVVIVDELTRVRGVRKAQIVSRMNELIRCGEIDQFIGVDVLTDKLEVPEYYSGEAICKVIL